MNNKIEEKYLTTENYKKFLSNVLLSLKSQKSITPEKTIEEGKIRIMTGYIKIISDKREISDYKITSERAPKFFYGSRYMLKLVGGRARNNNSYNIDFGWNYNNNRDIKKLLKDIFDILNNIEDVYRKREANKLLELISNDISSTISADLKRDSKINDVLNK